MEHYNGIIRMFRGDSFSQPIKINLGSKLDDNYYQLTGRDTLYVGIMEPNKSFEEAVIRKKYTNADDTDKDGNTLFKLNPDDTLNLHVGKYFYMIKLKTIDMFGDTFIKTIVPPTQFWIEGNNPEIDDGKDRYEVNDYDVNHIILDGGDFDLMEGDID